MAKQTAVATPKKKPGRPSKKYQTAAPAQSKPKPAEKTVSAPLPPPVEVPGAVPVSADPYNLGPMFQNPEDSAQLSGISSVSEPEPGEPLSPEAEALLSGEADDPGGPGEVPAPAGMVVPSISFSTEKTEKVLIEIFDWFADRFESDHWKLSENQVSMLGGPTAELLGGVWSKLAEKLPDMLTQTPGATAFLLAVTIVVVPKAAQQVAVSRARKHGKAPAPARRPGPGPVPVPNRAPADGFPAEVETIIGNDFQVTGD